MSYWWDRALESTRNVIEQDEQSWLVRYPKEGGGYFTLKFKIKKNPIGFIWSK